MRAGRVFIVIGVFACLALQAPPADAQAAFLTKCAKIIMKYVGEPLTAGMAERGGELLMDHFMQKFQEQEQQPEQQQQGIVITPEDVEALKQEGEARGMTECEVRRQIEMAYGDTPTELPPPAPYAAEAYCSATGVVGFVEGMSTPGQAIDGAVYDCINRGGIPACCANGASLVY
jgi:hypothetical protein